MGYVLIYTLVAMGMTVLWLSVPGTADSAFVALLCHLSGCMAACIVWLVKKANEWNREADRLEREMDARRAQWIEAGTGETHSGSTAEPRKPGPAKQDAPQGDQHGTR